MNSILIAYPWLTNDFILKSIRNSQTKSGISINSYEFDKIGGKGENFASNMIGIMVNYSIDGHSYKKNFILKATLNTKTMQEVTERYQFFTKEITVYKYIMPQVENLLKSAGIYCQISPR